jgi:hypothetical protein
MNKAKSPRALRADKPSHTVAEMNSFLDRRVGRRNHVRDAVENAWIVAGRGPSGEGRGFRVVTRDGLWRRVVIEPMALN